MDDVAENMGARPSAQRQLQAVDGGRLIALIAVMLSGPPLMALCFGTIAPVLPSIARHFGREIDGTLLAQWIMTMPAIGLMLGGPVGGWLIDRIGPRPLIASAFALFALAGSAGLWAEHATTLLVARFFVGFAAAAAATAATWLIGMRFEEQARRRLIGVQDAFAGVTAMSAVLLSGIAAASGGWRAPFAIYLLGVPLLLLALLSIPRIGSTQRDKATGPGIADLRPLWPTYAIIVSMAGLMMMPATQVPFLLEAGGVIDPIVRSRVIAASALTSIIASACYGPVRTWVGERNVLLSILAAYMAGTFTLALSDGVWTAAIGCLLLGCGTGLFSPHFASLLIARAAPTARARALGLMFGAIFLSEFLSPLLMLPLRRIFGIHGAFLTLAAVLLAAFILFIVQSRVFAHSMERRSEL